MKLLQARGAMLLLFDIADDAVDEHDDWHTHEHMPERLAIPGFLRGTRWTRESSGPRYCVLYEVEDLAVLDGPAYRARLDHPTPWTAKMMTRYIGMRRTLCEVTAGDGGGIGAACLVVTFEPAAGRSEELRRRLAAEVVPGLSGRRGLAACRLLENALRARMTREQAIRGRDDSVHSALWVTGYDAEVVASMAADELSPQRLAGCGATGVEQMIFALAYSLTAGAGRPGLDAASVVSTDGSEPQ
jgi:hypothetical protein